MVFNVNDKLFLFFTRYKRCDQIEERKARRLSGRSVPKGNLLHVYVNMLLQTFVA